MTQKISIDLNQLRESSTAVKHDVTEGLEPGLSTADDSIQHGVRFARRSPSGEAQAAGSALVATLRRHKENGKRHLHTAQLLTTVLDKILVYYSTTDDETGLDINRLWQEVEAVLPPAVAQQAATRGRLS